MKLKIIIHLLLLIHFSKTWTEIENKILKICPVATKTLTFRTFKTENGQPKKIEYDLVKKLKNINKSGGGGFAQFKIIDLKENFGVKKDPQHKYQFGVKIEPMPDKNAENQNEHYESILQMKYTELKIIKKFTKVAIDFGTPSLHACQSEINSENQKILIVNSVLSLMNYDLGSEKGKSYFQSIDNYSKITILKELVKTLWFLFNFGFLHLDIKPANIVIRDADKKFFFIDFNLSLKNYQEKSMRGTPFFISPGMMKLEGSTVEPRDDLYSLAVTFIASLCEDCMLRLILPYNQDLNSLPKKIVFCAKEEETYDFTCQINIILNAVKILSQHGFGSFSFDVNDHKPETITFTELMVHFLMYDVHPYTYPEVDSILNSFLDLVVTRNRTFNPKK